MSSEIDGSATGIQVLSPGLPASRRFDPPSHVIPAVFLDPAGTFLKQEGNLLKSLYLCLRTFVNHFSFTGLNWTTFRRHCTTGITTDFLKSRDSDEKSNPRRKPKVYPLPGVTFLVETRK